MNAWIYRKPEATHIRGLCILCSTCPQKSRSDGTYRALCSTCDKKRFKEKRLVYPKYRRRKELICSRCSFVPEDKCQLDVHHKDGNHHNNDPNNLETLCANCHRLVHIKKARKAH